MIHILVVNGKETFPTKNAQELDSHCLRRYEQHKLCDSDLVPYVCCSGQEYHERFGPAPPDSRLDVLYRPPPLVMVAPTSLSQFTDQVSFASFLSCSAPEEYDEVDFVMAELGLAFHMKAGDILIRGNQGISPAQNPFVPKSEDAENLVLVSILAVPIVTHNPLS